MVLDQWFGVFVPAGTPPAIIARLNAEFGKSLAVPSIRESMLKTANEPIGAARKISRRLVRDELAKYAKLAKDLDIKGA